MTGDMPKLEIALAAYRGEVYLEQQLETLFAQTNQAWTLLVRDDASPDPHARNSARVEGALS